MDYDNLKENQQENILTLLCFDKDSAKLIINNIAPNLFDNVMFRTIAIKAINFYKTFNDVIGIHLPDELEVELRDDKKGELYESIVRNMWEAKDSVNKEYTLDKLNTFIKGQQLKKDIIKAAEMLQTHPVEEVESLLYNSRNRRIELFDAGLRFGIDRQRTLSRNYLDDSSMIFTGIPLLDIMQHVPTKKELYTIIGKSGDAKSWFLVHLSKQALKQRKKVLHITLELSEDRLKDRYIQAFFGMGSKKSDLQINSPVLRSDDWKVLSSISFNDITKLGKEIFYLENESTMKIVDEKLNNIFTPQLIIKEFPTGMLTIGMLQAYLDNLEEYYNFIPDLILIDYLALMAVDREKYRLDLGRLAVELRGIAVSRNVAIVSAAQANRVAENARLITRKHIAEDYSNIATSDVVLIPQSTAMEKKLGLRRIFVDKGRNGADGQIILVSQNLSIGQYCLNSALLSQNYFDMVETLSQFKKEAPND